LLADTRPGDVLLVEQVDRLSRLTEADWCKLRAAIEAKQVRVVALDLPTSWQLAAPGDHRARRASCSAKRKARRMAEPGDGNVLTATRRVTRSAG
jgi:hypothetical protein